MWCRCTHADINVFRPWIGFMDVVTNVPIKFWINCYFGMRISYDKKIMSFLGWEKEAHMLVLSFYRKHPNEWLYSLGVWGKRGEGCPVMQKFCKFDPAVSFINYNVYVHQLSCHFIWTENREFEVIAINKWIGKYMNWEMALYERDSGIRMMRTLWVLQHRALQRLAQIDSTKPTAHLQLDTLRCLTCSDLTM